jgi:hypothetical protein
MALQITLLSYLVQPQNINPSFHWQRDYYEHIIRDENDYWRIAEYIANNPGAWEDDEENPARMGRV